jgi:alpha-L-fucosidase 2
MVIKVDDSGKGSYAPPVDFAENSVYLWRVDEIKKEGVVIKGPVWSFKTFSWAKLVENEYIMWYKEPPKDKLATRVFESALPLGNGRLGAMVFGYTDEERILLNEDTVWRGWPVQNPDREGASEALKKIRQAIKDGDEELAIKIAREQFVSKTGYGTASFGASQSFCDLYLDFGHKLEDTTNYRRELNISNATSTVSYTYKGVTYKREVLCSYPDQVVAIRLTADTPGSLNFVTTFGTRHRSAVVTACGNQLLLRGNVDNRAKDAPKGMALEARATIIPSGGTLTAQENQVLPVTFDRGNRLEETLDRRRDSIIIADADSVTILIVGASDYKLEWPTYKGELPEKRNDATMAKLGTKSFEKIRADHIADYKELFDRVDIDINGGNTRVNLPTWDRKQAYNSNRDDRGMEELLFQYGRYLLISCSRPGCMPAHLQGLWVDNDPDWSGDYHLNINFQMNYWPAGSCNLSECTEPMVRLLKDAVIPGRISAQKSYGSPGWVLHHTVNSFGAGSAPGPWRGVHMMEAESGAFLCQNIWDAYAFTGDKEYLEKEIWPLLKGAAQSGLTICRRLAAIWSLAQAILRNGARCLTVPIIRR